MIEIADAKGKLMDRRTEILRGSPSRVSPDLLDQVRQLSPKLHRAEQQVAKIIVTEPEWVIGNPIKLLAQRAGVSEPTVMRICRKLGLDGFAAFKLKLAQDLVVADMLLRAESVPRGEQTSFAHRIQDNASQVMLRAARNLDDLMIARLAEAAAAAVRIFCLPLDGEATRIAEDAEARLFGLGLAVKTVADTSKHAAIAQALGSNDLVLYFATQSTGQPMPPGAEAAQARGITVGALAPQAHPLRSVADAFLGLTPSDGGLESVFPSDRKYADQLALDCLEMAVRGRLPRKR